MSDLIRRQDAVEALEQEIDNATPINGDLSSADGHYRYALRLAKNIIESLPSAEDVQRWIPCSERLPEDLEAVNVTWVNHNPPVYYQYTKDVPNADTAVYYRGVWYWWDSTICDVLGEYGEKCGAEQIDKDIEILAWMPLPEPYREDGEA